MSLFLKIRFQANRMNNPVGAPFPPAPRLRRAGRCDRVAAGMLLLQVLDMDKPSVTEALQL